MSVPNLGVRGWGGEKLGLTESFLGFRMTALVARDHPQGVDADKRQENKVVVLRKKQQADEQCQGESAPAINFMHGCRAVGTMWIAASL